MVGPRNFLGVISGNCCGVCGRGEGQGRSFAVHPVYPVSTPPADSVQGAYAQPSLLLSHSEEAALSPWLGFCMHRSREELISAYLISPSGIHASVAL